MPVGYRKTLRRTLTVLRPMSRLYGSWKGLVNALKQILPFWGDRVITVF